MFKKRITLHGQFERFPLVVNRQPDQGPVRLHSHAFTELVIVLSGKGVHYCDTDAYEIMAGDCFLVKGMHGYKNTRTLSLVNVLFIPDRLPVPWHEARKLPGYYAFFALEPAYRKIHNFHSRLRLTPPGLSHVSAIIDDMDKELLEKRQGFEIMAAGLFMQLIGFLSRAYSRMEGVRGTSLMGLSEVLGYLERCYMDRIRISDLIKLACMSKSNLLRAFKEVTNLAPIEYLIHLRIRHACALLREGTSSITQIAYAVGFNDSNYFTRQFTRIMSMTPRDFRTRGKSIGYSSISRVITMA